MGIHCLNALGLLSGSLSLFDFVVEFALNLADTSILLLLVEDCCAMLSSLKKSFLSLFWIKFIQLLLLGFHYS
jgi:hypothetical protein